MRRFPYMPHKADEQTVALYRGLIVLDFMYKTVCLDVVRLYNRTTSRLMLPAYTNCDIQLQKTSLLMMD